jgi:hypothetical protein
LNRDRSEIAVIVLVRIDGYPVAGSEALQVGVFAVPLNGGAPGNGVPDYAVIIGLDD